jgi:hypothetical protein
MDRDGTGMRGNGRMKKQNYSPFNFNGSTLFFLFKSNVGCFLAW